MTIYWKTLIGYGFIFWMILCATDFLGYTNIHKYKSNFDEYVPRSKDISDHAEIPTTPVKVLKRSVLKFGWNLLLWNCLTFISSIFVCSVLRTIFCMSWSVYRYCRYTNNTTQLRQTPYPSTDKYSKASSKIPIMIKSSSLLATRSSEINLKLKPTCVDSDKSCPNLTSSKGSTSNISNICKTIFKNDSIFSGKTDSDMYEKQLENKYQRLKEELLKVQTNSLKEHAVLSRKLDTVMKEKRDISKQLSVVQKENRAAKQQLEELLQEKSVLLKRLENATKEFKANTKSKKFALAKLEEVTCDVENLRQQLEQVTRDKEILEKKLRLLENEYNKLHERYIVASHGSHSARSHHQDNTPERDVSSEKAKPFNEQSHTDESKLESAQKIQAVGLIASVSQTELDMKKIQMKIKQLEKNLETFNFGQQQPECSTYEENRDQDGSELSLSMREITTDSQAEDDDSPHESGPISERSARYRNWAGKVGEFFSKTDQFAKIQALASKMHEKVCQLENIRERSESIDDNDTENELGEYSSNEEMRTVPNKIVSNSLAFKNFLKSLNNTESMKRQFRARPQSEIGFF